ncbi:MAG: toll/interleukin-1 receptor domain-containing protein [Pseudomonadota bacterium]|nr:toll/interleukin-1 receptor domain-containing protein [Pseudomonadota bacterium]
MSDIFISYASPDRPFAEKLSHALEQQGFSVWWDRTIAPGKTFDEVIEAALSEASCVIVVWSKMSVVSQWVRAEAGDAMNRGILIPVLHEEVTLPLVFRQIQAAQLSDWKGEADHPGFQQMLHAIRGIIGKPVVTVEDTDRQQAADEISGKPEDPHRDSPLPAIGETDSNKHIATKHVSLGKWLAVSVFVLAMALLLLKYLPHLSPGKSPIENEQAIQDVTTDKLVLEEDNQEVDQQKIVQDTTAPASDSQIPVNAPEVHDSTPVIVELAKNTVSQQVASQAKPAKVNPPAPVKNVESKDSGTKSIAKLEEKEQSKVDRVLTDKQPKPKTSVPAKVQKTIEEQPLVVVAKITDPVAKETAEPTTQQARKTMKIVIAVFGMPDDEGLARKAEVKTFSRNISNIMAGIIESSLSADISFIHHFPDSGERRSLYFDAKRNKVNKKLCQEMNVDLVFFSLVEEIDRGLEGYAWWREPFFSRYDCNTGVRVYREEYHAREEKNEAFPFANGLAKSFRTFNERTHISKYQ